MINHKNTQRNCRASNAKRRKTAILEERATRRERGMWNCTDRAGDPRLFAPYRSPSPLPRSNSFSHLFFSLLFSLSLSLSLVLFITSPIKARRALGHNVTCEINKRVKCSKVCYLVDERRDRLYHLESTPKIPRNCPKEIAKPLQGLLSPGQTRLARLTFHACSIDILTRDTIITPWNGLFTST